MINGWCLSLEPHSIYYFWSFSLETFFFNLFFFDCSISKSIDFVIFCWIQVFFYPEHFTLFSYDFTFWFNVCNIRCNNKSIQATCDEKIKMNIFFWEKVDWKKCFTFRIPFSPQMKMIFNVNYMLHDNKLSSFERLMKMLKVNDEPKISP